MFHFVEAELCGSFNRMQSGVIDVGDRKVRIFFVSVRTRVFAMVIW